MPRIPLEPLQEPAERAKAPACASCRASSPSRRSRRYFRRADLVVLPYREIDQSGVLYTALAFGNALLLTDVGGFGEVAAAGCRGAGAARGPGGAARGDAAADRRPGAREALARSAQQAARSHYSWDAVAKRTLGLYEEMLGR